MKTFENYALTHLHTVWAGVQPLRRIIIASFCALYHTTQNTGQTFYHYFLVLYWTCLVLVKKNIKFEKDFQEANGPDKFSPLEQAGLFLSKFCFHCEPLFRWVFQAWIWSSGFFGGGNVKWFRRGYSFTLKIVRFRCTATI